MTTQISLALDWTPNTNHAGFYIAKHKGWYKEAGLDVSLLSPHVDGYTRTPASRVADGSATFCVTPSETVISAHTWGDAPGAKPKLVAVATLLQVGKRCGCWGRDAAAPGGQGTLLVQVGYATGRH